MNNSNLVTDCHHAYAHDYLTLTCIIYHISMYICVCIISYGSKSYPKILLQNLLASIGFTLYHNRIHNPDAPWCWNIYQHLPEQNHPVL